MDITLDQKGGNEASIKILLTPEDYQPKVDQKVKQYRKQVSLKGFRPGKVPPALIKKMYGRDIKVEEINGLLGQSLSEYIKENDIKIVGDPLPNREALEGIDWESQSDFEFSYDVGFVDDISYELSDQVEVTKYVVPITEEKIDETIKSLRSRFGKTETVEGASERNDLLIGNVAQVTAAQAETTTDSEGSEDDETLPVENETTIDLSALTDAQAKTFVGAQAGDELFFDLREVYPEDRDVATLLSIGEEAAADIQGEFSFTVEEVSRMTDAELNQELFDGVFGPGETTDEASFREKVREAVEDNFQRESETLLNRDLSDTLVEKTDIALPQAFLKRWVLVSNEGRITEEQLDAEFEDYLKEMKWTLLSSKIAEDRDIQVEHEEVRRKAAESVFAQFGGMNPALMEDERFAPIIDNYMQSDNGSNYMKHFSQVRAEKVIETVKQEVKVVEKEVTPDEFEKLWKQG